MTREDLEKENSALRARTPRGALALVARVQELEGRWPIITTKAASPLGDGLTVGVVKVSRQKRANSTLALCLLSTGRTDRRKGLWK